MTRYASLTGDDEPTQSADDYEARMCADLLEEIETLQNSGDYDWASDTLEGIHATVERTGRVTDGQRRAVQNIGGSRSANRHTGRMSRRYR